MAMPELPEELFLESVNALVRADRDWIPPGRRRAVPAAVHVRERGVPGREAGGRISLRGDRIVGRRLFQEGGATSVSVWATREYTRAAPGGTGAAKTGGNYAASLIALAEANRNGCDQVVFLDAVERRWVEELGGMNVFFVFEDGSLQTPAGASPSGKAPVFGTGIRRFESCRPSQTVDRGRTLYMVAVREGTLLPCQASEQAADHRRQAWTSTSATSRRSSAQDHLRRDRGRSGQARQIKGKTAKMRANRLAAELKVFFGWTASLRGTEVGLEVDPSRRLGDLRFPETPRSRKLSFRKSRGSSSSRRRGARLSSAACCCGC
jgi:hypothetical protein